MALIVDPRTQLLVNTGNTSGMAVKHEQHISDEHLADLANIREMNAAKPMGEMFHVCEVPVILVEKWKREGFDIYEQRGPKGVQAIVDRLKAEDMSAFVLTNKRIS